MSDADATPTPEPPRRRWGRRILLGVLGLLALVVLAVVLLLRTDAGLDVIRGVAVDVANDTLRGEVRIRRLHGDALSTLHLEGLEVRTATGGEVLSLEALTLEWQPSALLSGEIVVDRVALTAPRARLVQTSSTSWNVLDVLPPPDANPPPPSDAPLNLPSLRVDDLTVEGGEVDVRPADAEPIAIRALSLAARGEASGDDVKVELRSLEARGAPMVDRVALRTEAALDGDRAEIRDLRLEAGAGRVEIPELDTRIPPGPLQGEVRVVAPRALLVALGAPPAWKPDVAMDLTVRRAADDPRWTVRGTADLGPTPMTLAATATEDLSDLRVALNARRVDPRAVLPDLPQADLRLALTATGDLANPIRPRAQAHLELRGRLRPPGREWVDVAPLAVDATWSGGRAEVRAKGRVGAARLDVDAAVRDVTTTPYVEDGRVRVDAPDLGALLGEDAAGQATLTATVSGPVDGLEARGRLDARGLRYGGALAVRRVSAGWSMDRVWPAPRGEATVRVDALRADGRPVDRLRFAARAEGEGDATRVDLTRLELDTDGLSWRGGGAVARLHPDGRAQVRGFGLRSDAGRLRLDGGYDPGGASQLTLSVIDLDLGALPRRVVPELDTYQGVVNLDAQANLQGRSVSADVALGARGLALAPDEPEVELSADVALRPAALTLTATAGSDRLGRVRVESRSIPPRDMLAPKGWAALADRPVERLRVGLERLKLGRLQQILGEDPLLTGGLSGEITVDDAGRRARVDLRTVNLDVQSVAQPALQIRARFDPEEIGVDARLRGPNVGRATVTATAAAPRTLFDVEGWQKTDEAAIERAEVDLDRFGLDLLDRLGVVPGLSGRLSASVDLAPEVVDGDRQLLVVAEAAASQVRAPALYRPLDAQLSLSVDHQRLALEARVDAEGTNLVRVDARAPLPLRRLLRGGSDTLPNTPIQIDAAVDALPLSLAAQIAGLPANRVAGTVTASVTARGTPQAPRGRARVTLDDLELDTVRFDVATVTATLAEGRAQASLRMAGPKAGRLRASVETPVESPDLDARLTARGFELRFLSGLGLLPIGLDADLYADVTARGPPDEIRPRGWVELRDMAVVFEQAVLHPLSEGKARVDLAPDDVRVEFGARAGEGRVEASAKVTLPEDAPIDISATAKLDKYPVSAGTLVRVDIEADVEGQSGPDGTDIEVSLHDGYVDVPDQGTESLHPISTPDDVYYVDRLPGGRRYAKTSTVSAGPPTRVSVTTRDPIDVRGGPVIARLATDVRARTTPAGAVLGGRAYTTDGTIELFRRRYDIVKAQLTFTGESPPDPRVDVRLRHQFPTLELTLRIAGTANEPELSFVGRPARYSQAELLTIFLGTDPQELGQTSDATLEQQAQGAVAGFLVGQLQNQIGRVLPIDTLDVELGPDAGVSGARVTLGKWITRQIFVAYRYRFDANPEQENTNEAVIQYRFLPGWMAEAVLGLTRNDLDIFWTKRF